MPVGQGDEILIPGSSAIWPDNSRIWLDDGTGQGQRYMGNVVGTLLPSGARTTSATGAALANPNHRGLIVYINVTAIGGTPTFGIRVNAVDPVTGNFFPVWTPATFTPVASTLYVYAMYPTALAGSFTGTLNSILTRTWSVDALITGGSPSVTFSMGYSLLL